MQARGPVLVGSTSGAFRHGFTPSEEHFEWVLLCEQQQQVAGARGGGEPLAFGFRPSSSFHMSHVTF